MCNYIEASDSDESLHQKPRKMYVYYFLPNFTSAFRTAEELYNEHLRLREEKIVKYIDDGFVVKEEETRTSMIFQ